MMSTAHAVIIISLSAMLTAQLIKFTVHAVVFKKIDESILISTGGMPSSHSALVTSLVTSIGMFEMHENGTVSLIFAVALVLALVVVHDSMGIRYEASKHAKELNIIKLRLNLIENIDVEEKKLKEALGHKPREVLVGVCFGVLFAVFGFFIFRIF